MKAQLCPKCGGSGTLPDHPWSQDLQTYTANNFALDSFICDLCNGAKVIYVPDKED